MLYIIHIIFLNLCIKAYAHVVNVDVRILNTNVHLHIEDGHIRRNIVILNNFKHS